MPLSDQTPSTPECAKGHTRLDPTCMACLWARIQEQTDALADEREARARADAEVERLREEIRKANVLWAAAQERWEAKVDQLLVAYGVFKGPDAGRSK